MVVFAVGVMVMAVGLVCELVVRTRYQLAGQHPWEIARGVNIDTTGGGGEAGGPGADRG